MDEIKKQSIYLNPNTSGIQQIIGRVPSWLVLYGTTVFVFTIAVAGLASWMIKYSEKITVPVTIKTINGPIQYKNQKYSIITRILAHDKSIVKRDQPIFYINGDADIYEVFKLSDALNKIDQNDLTELTTVALVKDKCLLGPLEFDYLKLYKGIKKYRSNTNIANRKNLKRCLMLLKHQIYDWKKSHVISSPVSGKLVLNDHFEIGEVIIENEPLFTLIPNDIKISGTLLIPGKYVGQIQRGLDVALRLDSYPEDQYGRIQTKVKEVFNQEQGSCTQLAAISLSNKMMTSSGFSVNISNYQRGEGEITLRRTRLIKRLLGSI